MKTETTADLNVLHEQKSKSASEDYERHVEGNKQQTDGESTFESAFCLMGCDYTTTEFKLRGSKKPEMTTKMQTAQTETSFLCTFVTLRLCF